MPNVGRPSGGCHSCKRMKVRCDEERPSCRRCIGANRSCPGYGPVSDVFRRANVASKGRFVTLSTAKTPAIAATRDPTATETSLAHRPLPVDWEACGVSMFIHHYTIPDLDPVYGGYMPSLPEFYSANTGVGYLRNAMLAVSQALLAHDAKSEPMFLKAREYRAQAFRDLRPALLDEHEAISDHVLLALFLLERFELLSGENQSAKVWYNHSEGFSTLLHLRGDAQLETPIGQQLLRWINVHLIIRDNFYGTKLAYPEPTSGSLRSKAGGRQTHVMNRMGKLLHELKAIQEEQHGKPEFLLAQIDDMLVEAQEIRVYLEAWHPDLPVPKYYTVRAGFSESYNMPPLRMSPNTIPGSIHILRSFTEGSAFNYYWTLWIRWARFTVDCYRQRSMFGSATSSPNATSPPVPSPYTIPKDLPPDILKCLSHAVDRVARTIPFMTSELPLVSTAEGFQVASTPHSPSYTPPQGCAFGSWASLFHLNNIVSTPEIDVVHPGVRAWALSRLLDLKNRVGIKQAGAFHDMFLARQAKGRALRNLFRFEQEEGGARQTSENYLRPE